MAEKIVFKDFNFKLAVVQVLMYQKKCLGPLFDVYEFTEGYTGRQIDVEDEGYDIIPEVKAYFEQLDIPAELLPLVDELSQDGGDDIYMQLCPYWDGEDDIFNIYSAEDAALLPNLKSVTLFYDDAGERILQEFRQRGITAKWL